MQERLAVCRQELAEIEIEMSHYKKEQPDKFSNKSQDILIKILKILGRIKSFSIKYQHDSKISCNDSNVFGVNSVLNYALGYPLT